MLRLSPFERSFIHSGVFHGVRGDGRDRKQYRTVCVQQQTVPSAHGSASVQLGATRVVVGVKLEAVHPLPSQPTRGSVYCSVDFSSSALSQFGEKRSRDLSAGLSSALEKIYVDSGVVDLDALCIIPHKLCWNVHIDAIVLDVDGGVLDAISVGARRALLTAEVPKIEVIGDASKEAEVDFRVSADASDSVRLTLHDLPICVSLTKIGNFFLADACYQEELCRDVQVCVAVNSAGKVCAVATFGTGSIPPNALFECIDFARSSGKKLIESIDRDNVSS